MGIIQDIHNLLLHELGTKLKVLHYRAAYVSAGALQDMI